MSPKNQGPFQKGSYPSKQCFLGAMLVFQVCINQIPSFLSPRRVPMTCWWISRRVKTVKMRFMESFTCFCPRQTEGSGSRLHSWRILKGREIQHPIFHIFPYHVQCSSWWFEPIWNICAFVKLDHLPRDWGEIPNICEFPPPSYPTRTKQLRHLAIFTQKGCFFSPEIRYPLLAIIHLSVFGRIYIIIDLGGVEHAKKKDISPKMMKCTLWNYPSSNNHASVENGCISSISFLSFRENFPWTMIMGGSWIKTRC